MTGTEGFRLPDATNQAKVQPASGRASGRAAAGDGGSQSVGVAVSRHELADGFRSLFDDEVAFRRWYDQMVPRVYGYLHDRVGGVRSVAEELTQETFMEVVRNRARFDGRSDPMTWVIAIARHKLTDHYRRLGREERRHLRLLPGRSDEGSAADPFEATDSREDVLRALRSLPTMQRACLVFRYLDQLPVREIAQDIGRSESSVESL
jgi:RNA polymerase sigma-70 factor (ECF subfamily)